MEFLKEFYVFNKQPNWFFFFFFLHLRSIGFYFCNKREHFCRWEGMVWATGRFFSIYAKICRFLAWETDIGGNSAPCEPWVLGKSLNLGVYIVIKWQNKNADVIGLYKD